MLLLASVASNQEWIRVYKGLMMGVQGENVVVLKGRMALDKMEKDLQPYAQTPPVTAAASTSQTIVLTMDKEAFVLVCRVCVRACVRACVCVCACVCACLCACICM